MNNIIAFFLGMLTILIIIFSFWFIASINKTVAIAYSNSICYNIPQSTDGENIV